eukprot:TRINITY_DN3375_c0_g1_i1.p1 TRINITY_DN3375_c0_g1~~TRINITY_DN3375_c0_g1_i1.p1  ORF type:complete len:864 (-),score=134.85 TRINITY_DN3375_c0_g1_i1:118-2631(-)
MPSRKATQKFSGETIDDDNCQARIWKCGYGGQCSRKRTQQCRFCNAHATEDKWKVHGEVTKPVPARKLRDFEKATGHLIASGGSGGRGNTADGHGTCQRKDGAASKRAVVDKLGRTSVTADKAALASTGAIADMGFPETNDDVAEGDSESDGGAFDRNEMLSLAESGGSAFCEMLERRVRFGSGSIEGAAVVAGHVRSAAGALTATNLEANAAEGTVDATDPGTPTRKRLLQRDVSDEKQLEKKCHGASTDPGTPTRKRVLQKEVSDVKQLEKKCHGASSTDPGTPIGRKRVLDRDLSDPKELAKKVSRIVDDRQQAGSEQLAKPQQEFDALLESAGVPSWGRSRLLPLLERWGTARASQIAGLWTFLGDGATKPISVPSLHVWGPAGTGKTALLVDFLDTLGICSLWVNCACFTAVGELQAHIVELLRRWAQQSSEAANSAVKLPREMQRRLALGKQIRALDRLEFSTGKIIDHVLEHSLAAANGTATDADVKVLLLLDQAQELGRLGVGAAELLTSLPEVLSRGSQLSVATVARTPLSCLCRGRTQSQAEALEDPPSVPFRHYTPKEAEAILLRELRKTHDGNDSSPLVAHLQMIVSVGLLTYAAPHVGRGLDVLLSIGEELLRDASGQLKATAGVGGGDFSSALQSCVEQALESRSGLCGLSGFRDMASNEDGYMDPTYAAAMAATRRMTQAEKRLIFSAYLATRIPKENDIRLFAPRFQRGNRMNRKAARGRHKDEQPLQARVPRPTTLARVLAIYYHFAEDVGNFEKQDLEMPLLGGPLFEHLSRLCEVGLLQLERASLEQDALIGCRAEFGLVKLCAKELNLNHREYLCED